MKKLGIGVVVLCLIIYAWMVFSTLDAQGFWNGTLTRDSGEVAFRYRIQPSRNGWNAWISVNDGPDRSMDALDLQESHIRFDLPVDGRVYHLDGEVINRTINGDWRLDDGSHGRWNAQRYSVKQD